MKVRDLVKKFDELLAKFEQAARERDELKKKLAEAESAAKQAGPAAQAGETDPPPEWKKKEEDLLGRIKVLEKHKAGLQDKCISLEKERKAAEEKNRELEAQLKGEMQTLLNITPQKKEKA